MEKKIKVKIAFADAVITNMWLKGLITAQERDQMQQKCDEKLRKTTAGWLEIHPPGSKSEVSFT